MRPSFFTDMVVTQSKQIIHFPFGEDYRHVNALKAFLQAKERLFLEIEIFSIKELLPEEFELIAISSQRINELHGLLKASKEISDELLQEYNETKAKITKICLKYKMDEARVKEAVEKKIKAKQDLSYVDRRLEEEIIPFFRKILTGHSEPDSPWQKKIHDSFLEKYTQDDLKEFIDYVGFITNDFLPKHYLNVLGELFPNGKEYAYNDGFAHFQRCKHAERTNEHLIGLLASRAPKKMGGESSADKDARNAQSLQSFLNMMFDTNVSYVLALGPTGDRLDYKSVFEGRYQARFNQKNNIITVVDTQNNARREIHFSHFGVADQTELSLSSSEVGELLKIYKYYKGGLVLVHCDSGVGRTGQIRFLFAMLDCLNGDFPSLIRVATVIDGLVNNRSNNVEDLINMLLRKMKAVIKELRQVRYCIEVESQFLGSIPLLILLIAHQRNCYSSNQLCALRQSLGIPEIVKQKKIVEFGEETDSFSSAASERPVARPYPLFPRRSSSPAVIPPEKPPSKLPMPPVVGPYGTFIRKAVSNISGQRPVSAQRRGTTIFRPH